MSFGTMSQLRQSYARVIDSTLKKVRDGGVLREAGRETIDELGTRWRAAVERELQAMENRHPERTAAPKGRRGEKLPLEALVPDADPTSSLTRALRDVQPASLCDAGSAAKPFRHMEGVRFADAFEPPTPIEPDNSNALGLPSGFAASHVESAEGAFGGSTSMSLASAPAVARPGSASTSSGQPVRKKARTGVSDIATAPAPALGRAESSEGVGALAPSAAAKPEPVLAPVLAPPLAADSDDEYADCFEDAKIVVSKPSPEISTTPAAGSGTSATNHPMSSGPKDTVAGVSADKEESSAGSELGSELDDSEWDEPDTINTILAELTSVRRSKRRWSVEMRHGVLQIDGIECLFSGASGVFEFDDGFSLAISSKQVGRPVRHSSGAITATRDDGEVADDGPASPKKKGKPRKIVTTD